MIEQPQSVPIPNDLAQAIENARNNVSVLEAESSRLERLIMTQKRELISQEGTKADLEKKIVETNVALTSIRAEFDSLIISNNALREENVQVGEENLRIEAEITEKNQLLNEKDQFLTNRELAVLKDEDNLNTREDDFLEKETLFQEKVDKLNVVLKEIA